MTFYIISQFSFKDFEDLRSIEGIIKPLLIAMSYNFTLSFDFCPIYGAIKTQKVVNPMLAFSSWVWMSIVYGNQQASADADSMTLFSEYHLGRYIWLYMVIPLVASMLAAKLANKHLASVSDIMVFPGIIFRQILQTAFTQFLIFFSDSTI